MEGWVEEVTATAVAPHLPHAVPLREMLRRRRAAGGPAEDTFRQLVGLELRPRRARDAARLWALIARDRGITGRDELWSQLDLFPTTEDLEHPELFGDRRADEDDVTADLDAALEAILNDTGADDAPRENPAQQAPATDEGTEAAEPPDEPGDAEPGDAPRPGGPTG
ncbi:hypothetical protein GCM10027067_30880 [Pseudactinotalea suaedae]